MHNVQYQQLICKIVFCPEIITFIRFSQFQHHNSRIRWCFTLEDLYLSNFPISLSRMWDKKNYLSQCGILFVRQNYMALGTTSPSWVMKSYRQPLTRKSGNVLQFVGSGWSHIMWWLNCRKQNKTNHPHWRNSLFKIEELTVGNKMTDMDHDLVSAHSSHIICIT
jgi:hypothetical protein